MQVFRPILLLSFLALLVVTAKFLVIPDQSQHFADWLDGIKVEREIAAVVPNPLPPSRLVVWYHAWGEPSDNIAALGASKFVTHVIIGNLDFNEQLTISSDVLAKINAVKNAGMTPILSRWLFFQDGKNSTIPEAPQFKDSYADGSIVHNAAYFEWFLKKLRAEASSLGIDLVAVDTEPHFSSGASTNFKEDILQAELQGMPTVFNEIATAVSNALNQPGVAPADYIYPTDSYPKNFSGYRALSELGTYKVNSATYRDCIPRLKWVDNSDADILGVWVTAFPGCYRSPSVTNCNLNTCPLTPAPQTADALWTPATIFQNVTYWYNKNRGLFLYSSGNDTSVFPGALNTYCQANLNLCNQYNYSGKTIPDITPPSTPLSLVASELTSSAITLEWVASSDNVAVVKYRVSRNGTTIGETNTQRLVDTNLPAANSYRYEVLALDAAGNISLPSDPLTLSAESINPLSGSDGSNSNQGGGGGGGGGRNRGGDTGTSVVTVTVPTANLNVLTLDQLRALLIDLIRQALAILIKMVQDSLASQGR